MVWRRMGLLDDAIREHLELKRLRGADPGQVAQEQHAALGPVRRGPEEDDSPIEIDESPSAQDDGPPAGAAAGDLSEPATGQETLEINMEAELRDDGGDGGAIDKLAEPSRDVGAAPAGHQPSPVSDAQDSLEWEVPGFGTRGEPGRRLDDEAEGDESVDDVLEETPDFLRETPEHERLWFEQRPPRDFDFNE